MDEGQDEDCNMTNVDQSLLSYCTDKQFPYIEAVVQEGSRRRAAKLLGCAKGTVDYHVEQVRKQASARGVYNGLDYSKAIPPTHRLGKVTQTIEADGTLSKSWVRAEPVVEEMNTVARHLAQSMVESVNPIKPIKQPKDLIDTKMVAYVIADLHLGMYAWDKEAGDDYDCAIAGELLCSAMSRLTDSSPKTKTAIIAQLGDYCHLNDETNQTPRGKNQLDVDSRWKRVIDIGINLYKTAIELALTKHDQVTVYNIRGNHDMYSAYLIGAALQQRYMLNERVKIVNDQADYSYHQFGKVLIGLAHGHLAKPRELGDIMLCDKRKEVGESDHCIWWSGHIHHLTAEDFGWFMHESFATLAAKDAHAATRWRSHRTMDAIVIDAYEGECGRSRVHAKGLLR